MGVDSCHQSLSRRLFVSRRTVHLPGEVETPDEFRFERVMQLRRRKIIVFDGISGTEDVQIFESGDFVQRLPLHLPRQRRRKSVQIVFVGRFPFGFEKELVLLLVGEGPELVFDRRAVARSDAADRAVEERRTVESAAQNGVHFGCCIDQKAR